MDKFITSYSRDHNSAGVFRNVHVHGGIIQITDTNVIAQQNVSESLKMADKKNIWFDVKSPVETFTGREKKLNGLHDSMKKNGNKLTAISQIVVICGLGGVGKTELSRMYAYKYSEYYNKNVIWINAETRASMSDSILKLSEALNISTKTIDGREKRIELIIQLAYEHFNDKKCLFIFDNAEQMNTSKDGDGIREFLPQLPKNGNTLNVLITSRNNEWDAHINKIILNPFTDDDAEKFIIESLGVEMNKNNEYLNVKNLAKSLENFPLALQLAVSYINEQNEFNYGKIYTIGNYIDDYQKESLNTTELFKNQSSDAHCDIKTITTIWNMTFDKIKLREYGKRSLEILNLIAYFSPKNIPLKLFNYDGNENENKNAIRLLKRYSIITLKHGEINIHLLVQIVVRHKLKFSESYKEESVLERGMRIFDKIIKTQELDKGFIVHSQSVCIYSLKYERITKHLGDVPIHIMKNLIKGGKYNDTINFGKSIVNLLEKYNYIEPKHKTYLSTTETLADALYYQRYDEEAFKLYKEVYEKRKNQLGSDHPDTLRSQMGIADVMYNLGQYDEALKLYKEVHEKRINQLGSDHPDTLSSKNNMAVVLRNLGQYEETLNFYKEVYEKRKNQLGSDHPDTLSSQMGITAVMWKLGQYEKALNFYKEVHEKRKNQLGSDHPDTLRSQNNMAVVLRNLGQYEEALNFYKEVHEKRINQLGSDHPDTLSSKNNMAVVLQELGKYDEALKLFKEVYEKQKNQLGSDHPDTLSSKNNMAVVLKELGKYDEALKLYKEVYEKQKNQLGSDHPDTLSSQNNMAVLLQELGKYDQVLKLYKEVHEKRKNQLGSDHPDTLRSQNNIANVMWKLGEYEKALKSYKEVYEKQKNQLGSDHPDTLSLQYNIAFVLEDLGKYDEALKLYKEVHEKRKNQLGSNHPKTLNAQRRIVLVLDKLGQHKRRTKICSLL